MIEKKKMDKVPFDERIETERLIMKRHEVTFDYALMWYKLVQEKKGFWLRFLEHFDKITSVEQEYEYFVSIDKKWRVGDKLSYALWTKEGNLIGNCQTENLNYDRQEAEIGYLLFEEYTGKGYMTEAVKAFEKKLFSYGFNRLTIVMDSENKASENVAVRCGFTKECVMRQCHYNSRIDSWRDMCLYSKLKKEWEKER